MTVTSPAVPEEFQGHWHLLSTYQPTGELMNLVQRKARPPECASSHAFDVPQQPSSLLLLPTTWLIGAVEWLGARAWVLGGY